jgi:hypothetical protein
MEFTRIAEWRLRAEPVRRRVTCLAEKTYLSAVEADARISDGGMSVDVARKLRANSTGRPVVEHRLRFN